MDPREPIDVTPREPDEAVPSAPARSPWGSLLLVVVIVAAVTLATKPGVHAHAPAGAVPTAATTTSRAPDTDAGAAAMAERSSAAPEHAPAPAGLPLRDVTRWRLPLRYVERVVATPDALYALGCGLCWDGRTVVVRIDPRTGAVDHMRAVGGAVELAVVGETVWLSLGLIDDHALPVSPPALVELRASDLAVVRVVPLMHTPRDLAYAGGRLWVATSGELESVDVTTGRVIAGVSVPDMADGFLSLAVGPDGALWTGTSLSDASPSPVHVRDPASGRVLTSGTTVTSVGAPRLLATAGGVWAAAGDAMNPSYQHLHVDKDGVSAGGDPVRTTLGPSFRLGMAGGVLWAYDGSRVECLDQRSGQVSLASDAAPPGGVVNAVAPAADGRVIIAYGGDLLLGRPDAGCQRGR